MFALEDENVLFLYCWTVNEMQIPATRDRDPGVGPLRRPARMVRSSDLDRFRNTGNAAGTLESGRALSVHPGGWITAQRLRPLKARLLSVCGQNCSCSN